MIRIACPDCRQNVTFSDEVAGLSMPCPACRVRLDVPNFPSEAAFKLIRETAASLARPGEAAPELTWVVPARRRRLPLVAAALGIFFAVCGLSWLFAGSTVWGIILLCLAVIPGGIAVGYLWALVRSFGKGFSAREDLPAIGVFACIALVLGAGFFINHQFARSTVHLDNFSSHDVTVEIDGSRWRAVPRGRTMSATLRRGEYTLVIRDQKDGKVLDRLQVKVENAGYYVLNVLGAQVYAKGVAQYGGIRFGPSTEKAIQERWFRADIDYLFEEPPQSITVSSRRGQSAYSADRTYLRRGLPRNEKR